LTISQVSDELVEFVSSVDEICIVDDLAKNERVFLGCHITLISVTLSGVIGKCSDRFEGYADWRNANKKASENKHLNGDLLGDSKDHVE
jgi:hypothetical protein